MAAFFLFVFGIPFAGFMVTYAIGRWLGSLAARVCWLLSLLPLAWTGYQFIRCWREMPNDGMAMGISGLALIFSGILTLASALGWWLSGRTRSASTEAGTGLSQSERCPPT